MARQFYRLFVLSVLGSLLLPAEANAQDWCVEEFIEKRVEAIRNLQEPPTGEWDTEITKVQDALKLDGKIVSVPCNHNSKVVAHVVGDGNDKAPPGEYIIYDPDWVRETIRMNAVETWFVIGHELGHFANRHFSNRSFISNEEKELEADGVGACAVGRHGGVWAELQEVIEIYRPDGQAGYPTAAESLPLAREKYIACGGMDESTCPEGEWDEACPPDGLADWVTDLSLFMVKYLDDAVLIQTLEIRTNLSGERIKRLEPEPFVAFGEPTNVTLSIRRIVDGALPGNFGLSDLPSFSNFNNSTRTALLTASFEDMFRTLGQEEGNFRYTKNEDGNVQAEADGISATVAKDVGDNYWSIYSRLPELTVPVEHGERLFIVSEVTYPIESSEYFSSGEVEQWGATSQFPVRNMVISIDASSIDQNVRKTSVSSFVREQDGEVDDQKFKLIGDVDEDRLVLYFKTVPAKTGIFLEYSWDS